MDRALERKLIANSLYRQEKYKESALEYDNALSLFTNVNNETKVMLEQTNYNNLLIECLNNLAMCCLKLKDFNEVLVTTDKVSSSNSKN